MTMEERIVTRLHQALDQLSAAGVEAPTAERGLCVGGPDNPIIVLTVDDVSRIAALAARGDALSHESRL
jgi:hypothetical protein